MALFGNTPNPQPNAYMPAGAYGQAPQGMMPGAQAPVMYSNGGMMPTSYPQGQMMGAGGGYSMAGQPNMMLASQPGLVYQQPQQLQQQQGMMGMPAQQHMMGGQQHAAFINQQQQQQLYAQQMQTQMASMSINQQKMGGLPNQGAVATGNTGASWGNTGNGQTLNGSLWN